MNLFSQWIIQSIKASNAFIGSEEVMNLIEIIRTPYSYNVQEQIINILKNGEYTKLKMFEPSNDLLSEELAVFQFSNEKGRLMYALFFESFTLSKGSEIFGVYPEV
ncbi:hypothetical protein HRH25_08310 [Flavisolibacter sp. BT320]|nr:hypothetical protein [Flavisolibacter longurius]